MNILLVTARYPFGAAEAFLEPELRALVRAGHHVAVAPVRRLGMQRVMPRGVELVNRTWMGGFRRLARAWRLLSLVRFRTAKTDLLSIGVALSVIPALSDSPPDVVHGYWATAPASVAHSVGLLLDRPWSFTGHRYDLMANPALGRHLNSASAVRFISNDGLSLAVAATGQVPDVRWRVLRLGIDPGAVRETDLSGPEIPHFLAVGRLEPVKGHALLIDAFAELLSAGSPSRLTIIGDGPLRGVLEERAADRGVAASVTFAGDVDHDEVLRAMHPAAVTALVLPSYHEGVPVVVMESMARGLPVIASSVGGVPELLGVGTGILVPAGDLNALRIGLETAITMTAAERSKLAREARERVTALHDVQNTTAGLSDLLRSTMEQA